SSGCPGIGRGGGPPGAVLRETEENTRVSQDTPALGLCLAINYGGRTELVDAVRALARQARDGALDPEQIDEAHIAGALYTAGMPAPDLLIRPAGRVRGSNFLLLPISYPALWVPRLLLPA